MHIIINKVHYKGDDFMKKYFNIASLYAIFAIISGVFYREFTKWNSYTGQTTLSVCHLHLFALGTIMFLIIALLCHSTNLEEKKSFHTFMKLYNIALVFMVIMFYVRGIVQVLGMALSKAANDSLSGVAGISHLLMTIAIIMLFTTLRKVDEKYS